MRNTLLKALNGRFLERKSDQEKLRRLDTLHEIDLIRKTKYLHPPS